MYAMLFLRFYGNEFDAAERERIMERLGRDEPDSRGSLRRVRVDWDDLEMALAAGHLIHVEPLGSRVEYGWMEEFAETVADARLRDRLEVALDGRGAFKRFKNVLLDFPEERERWFAFRDERLHAAAREWLRELGITPTTAPPVSR